MQIKWLAALCAAYLLCVTGCHLSGGCASGQCGGFGGGIGGCDDALCNTGCNGTCGAGGCAGGACGGSANLVGLLSGKFSGGKAAQANAPGYGMNQPAELSADGYGHRHGLMGGHMAMHHRGPQSHMGQFPGPADGPPTPAVTYPYYTSRGPRDFFVNNPPSIGP